jgi:hypothetical protein
MENLYYMLLNGMTSNCFALRESFYVLFSYYDLSYSIFIILNRSNSCMLSNLKVTPRVTRHTRKH